MQVKNSLLANFGILIEMLLMYSVTEKYIQIQCILGKFLYNYRSQDKEYCRNNK